MTPSELEQLVQVRNRLCRAIADALTETIAITDHATAWEQADWLAATLSGGVRSTARVKGRLARRWKQEEGLSVQQLSGKIHLSRGRTGDILSDRSFRNRGT